jgi:hypothetical protein
MEGVQVWGCGVARNILVTCGDLDLSIFLIGLGKFLKQTMPSHQRERPDTSSENEKGKVHCHHIPSCAKWMHHCTRNKHWKDLLHNEAQGKCMRCVRRVSRAHSCSVADSSDADDEGSSREDATVDEGGSGSSNEDTAVDEDSTSSSEDTTAELSVMKCPLQYYNGPQR